MASWMGELTGLKEGPRVALPLHCVPRMMGRTWRKSLIPGEAEGEQFRGTDVRLAHWLPRKPAEEHALGPLAKLS